ncbi:hypothetical protein [Sorangium sp. So ce1097]|uniref:hypothetical protein n=1 Tax=Sorangium sp. So ce1097 TaxID=3133330 RepID=UPI003F5DD2D0
MASRTKGTRGGGAPAVVDEEEVDDLYRKPLGDFTRARDALAKRLRQAGDKAAAERVKALRRPTAAAWALNQLARRYPQRMEALLDAGERLREAQRGAIDPGGAPALRGASQGHRAIVNELLRAAPALFAEGGYSEKGNPMDRLRDSLLATPTASASDLELLARGRLSGEIEPGDLSDMLGLLRGRPSERPAEADREAKAGRGRRATKAPQKTAREIKEPPEKQRRARERRAREEQRSAKERERTAAESEREAQRSAKERENKARLKAEERENKARLAAERRARKERLAAEQREQKARLAAAERERDQASREAARAAKEADRSTREAARMSRAAERAEEAARAARKRADEAEREAAEAQQKAADSAGRLEAAEDRLDRLDR